MKVQRGDLVKHKTGRGPVMTVGCRVGDAHWVHWWDEEAKDFRTGMLYLEELELAVKDNV